MTHHQHQQDKAMRAVRLSWAALSCFLAASGCSTGESLGTATGRVTFHGEAVTEGSVIFTDNARGAAYVAPLDANGKYELQVARGLGVPPGKYVVTIGPPRAKPSMDPMKNFAGPSAKKDYKNIPMKYRDEKTSGLEAVVVPGANNPFDFNME
jgi:hypothetical protein